MSVTVYIPSALRVEADGRSKVTIDAARAATLADVLDVLAELHPRLNRRVRDEQGRLRRYVNVFIDSDESRALSGTATPVRDGAEVRILPSVAGG
ncbi:ubiquitin-like small modifier protein 1 [Stackebrandtia soli]|uniref:ubiquitin-like small modifier protein 1 n=1 Tax=Stackebrandtia soli TaxID=1892856 RepID=UPI0039ED9ABE